MSFDEATIMAYVDVECDAVTVNRIEKAMATDPVLAKQIEQAQALRNRLSAHYDPVAEEAVPYRLTAMLTAAASSNIDSSFTARKADREIGKRQRRGMGIAQWGAMAATLALGVVIGQFGLHGDAGAPFAQTDGALVASGPLADALETQLASTQPDNSDFRIGLTFRAKTGNICRSFTSEAVSGIGCRDGQQWKMVSTLPGGNASNYRQASSSAVNEIAADLMADAPADTEIERKLMESGWK